ncbi:MAG: 3-isopropylmalate dehydratase small subunit [Deferribacteraceae bacterium]|jgi:3-isopropylmalate/(R)-2-methylmalate dehydratase small subunit|nr:3-isopropylmalate dehydratase small subunit [Deferribacteraceae bacterium]
MNGITTITGRAVPILMDDIDTDRIIPARFLRCVTFEGIGEHLFCDERTDPEFPLNKSEYKGAEIILSGNNFGCGSSREHAPQSIKRYGFKAVIAESFAEIFFGNSLTIGLVCATLPKSDILELASALTPSGSLEISLKDLTLTHKGIVYKIGVLESARTALINGSYDLLSELAANASEIKTRINALPY